MKRAIIAVLIGMTSCFLLGIFIKPTCWGPIIGVIAAIAIANVSSAKEGAIIGALIPVPIGVYVTIPIITNIQQSNHSSNILMLILSEIFVILLMIVVGAGYGLLIGKIYQIQKKGMIF